MRSGEGRGMLLSGSFRVLMFASCGVLLLLAPADFAPAGAAAIRSMTREQTPDTGVGGKAVAAAEREDPQLPLVEAIRSDHPERLFDLLEKNVAPLSDDQKMSLRAMARYRLGEFEAVKALLSRMNATAPVTLLMQSLLRAAEGRLAEAEGLVSAALARRSELGLLAFEAGLHHSYLLQHLGKPREAAAVIDRLLPDAPFGKPALRSIKKSLEASTGEMYRKEAVAEEHTIPLLADGSVPSRTVLSLHGQEPAKFVLFDTGSSLTMLKADVQKEVETGATALALDMDSSTDFQYGWQKSLTIAGWKVENVPVGFMDSKTERSARLNYDAIFGLPFLRRFFVVFDFPGRTMQLLQRASREIQGDPVPFHYVADQVIVHASINGKPANLLIDTGLALPSLRLDTSWAADVASLPSKEGGPAKSPDAEANRTGRQARQPPEPGSTPKVVNAIGTEVKSLRFGKQEMKDLSVTMDTLRRRMSQNPLAVRIDGILAAPLMREYVVSMDFENNRLYFQKQTDAK